MRGSLTMLLGRRSVHWEETQTYTNLAQDGAYFGYDDYSAPIEFSLNELQNMHIAIISVV